MQVSRNGAGLAYHQQQMKQFGKAALVAAGLVLLYLALLIIPPRGHDRQWDKAYFAHQRNPGGDSAWALEMENQGRMREDVLSAAVIEVLMLILGVGIYKTARYRRKKIA